MYRVKVYYLDDIYVDIYEKVKRCEMSASENFFVIHQEILSDNLKTFIYLKEIKKIEIESMGD